MIKIVKGVVVGLSAALLLTACSSKQETVSAPAKADMHKSMDRTMASDATASEIKAHDAYETHIKKLKKRKKINLKQPKVNLAKFCFKDNSSIHYKANERCK